MNYIISPSLLAADFSCLATEVKKVYDAGAKMLHLDVMDGQFVPNLSFGMPILESLRPTTEIIFDVHLMIKDPIKYIDQFAASGADIITFHYESDSDIQATIDKIKANGKKVAISISPDTPPEVLFPYLPQLDMVLVMSVYPGFGGQSFMPASLARIKTIRDYMKQQGLEIDIEVDGGINTKNVSDLYAAGANIIVAGSSVFRAPDPAAAIAELLALAEPYRA